MLKFRNFILFFIVQSFLIFETESVPCNCQPSRLVEKIYLKKRKCEIFCSEESWCYHYSQINKQLWNLVIKKPQYYHQFRNNILLFNETIYNFINFKKEESQVWPLYKDELADRIESCLDSIDYNYYLDDLIRTIFKDNYEWCFKYHQYQNPVFYYDYCFIAFNEGNVENSLEFAEKFILSKNEDIDSEHLVLLGETCLELAQFSKAISILSEAIKKNPQDKTAYFHRAAAYFEIGNFDDALNDFYKSNNGKEIAKSFLTASREFSDAFILGLTKGCIEGAVNFVPNLLNTAYGLNTTLWHQCAHPIQSKIDIINASYEIGNSVYEYCEDLNWEKIDNHIEELKFFVNQFNNLNDSEKGNQLGYLIGKYGIDIFIGAKGAQLITKYRNLKNANILCNFEAMSLSQATKETIAADSLKFAAKREEYLKNIKIHWDRQNKHIPGKHNYEVGRGIISIESTELEVLIKEHVGKGQKVIGEFGEVGYVERVDFGVIIGEYAKEIKGQPTQFMQTSKGTIKYAKDGKVHVVPSNPEAFIE